jgi:hypothetical protein
MKIQKGTIRYFLNAYKVPNQRFLSWDHCYSFFNTANTRHETHMACLHLGFYLASWGMYRGSGWLLDKDYLVHEKVVIEILKPDYQRLKDATAADYVNNADLIDLLFVLRNKIREIYKNVAQNYPSDILVTKILLGTLGCVPAYDRFFKAGLKKYQQPQIFSKKSFLKFMCFCLENQQDLDAFKKSIGKNNYPDMKIIDMYFWHVGLK